MRSGSALLIVGSLWGALGCSGAEGPPPATPGSTAWSRSFGSAAPDTGWATASDGSGNTYFLGRCASPLEGLEGARIEPSSELGLCVAKFDVAGANVWYHLFGEGTGSLAVDAAGTVTVVGTLGTEPAPGGGTTRAVWAARIDAGGTSVSRTSLFELLTRDDLPPTAELQALAGADGHLAIAMTAGGTTRIGPASFGDVQGGSTWTAVLMFDAAFSLLWSRPIGAPVIANLTPDDGVVVSGTFRSGINLGGVELTTGGEYAPFIARYDAAGEHVWSQRLGGTVEEYASGLAVTTADEVIVSTHDAAPIQADQTTTVRALDGAGNLVWSHAIAGLGTSKLAAGPAGGFALIGRASRAIDFGSGSVELLHGRDYVVVRMDPSGVARWARALGVGEDAAIGVVCDPSGGVAVTGLFTRWELDGGMILGRGPSRATDIFLAKFAP